MRNLLLFVVGFIWSCNANAEWKPVAGKITTQWASDVNPDKPWNEYPRPMMVRKHWVNLNGLWDYAIVAKDAKKPSEWNGEILVPYAIESALSGVGKNFWRQGVCKISRYAGRGVCPGWLDRARVCADGKSSSLRVKLRRTGYLLLLETPEGNLVEKQCQAFGGGVFWLKT